MLGFSSVLTSPFPGEGYDKNLKEILDAEILPLAEEFDQKLNSGNSTFSFFSSKAASINESEFLSKVRNLAV